MFLYIIMTNQVCMNCDTPLRDSNYFAEYIGFICFKCSNLSKANYYLKVCEKLKKENKDLKCQISKLNVSLRDFCSHLTEETI